MASNSLGTIFRIMTWGESHGKAIGVVIDGCPAGLELCDEEINCELFFRRPGKNPYVSQRKEEDHAEILSGVFEGKTSGAPISIIIYNQDSDSSKYEPIKDLLRPGHANYTYLEKYGLFDHRGGGRASGRETACRVAAGAVAKKILRHFSIDLISYVSAIGQEQSTEMVFDSFNEFKTRVRENPIFSPDGEKAARMIALIEKAKEEGDSLGGIVETYVVGLPVGLGDPIYEKLEANLAKAMLSLPASKGFEIGAGFSAARMNGSDHNDSFILESQGQIKTSTNFAGGTLGGMSSGMPLYFRVAMKPASSIQKEQTTLSIDKKVQKIQLPAGSRHDPCLAIRAAPVIEAMTALVLVDALLMNRSSRLDG